MNSEIRSLLRLSETYLENLHEGLGLGIGDFDESIHALNQTLLPLIRNVLPNIIAHDICGVQPMTGFGLFNPVVDQISDLHRGLDLGIEPFQDMLVFPLGGRPVKPNLIPYDTVGVQPMPGPISEIMTMRYSYGKSDEPQ